ncbi:MAG: glycosyltransferase [Deltaproteobacteria bacterium]|nr:glycosyltransferase [Deltaproteobacteria bacterium]MBW2697216.1 glycosyltransferase [Deltaproteobacteria bacterium]
MSHIAGSTTFIVKTFMRPGCLDRLVVSCRRFYPGVRILVADDSREPVSRDDVEVIVLPFDSGLSHGRNRLLDRVETKYFVLMDDDHVLTGETKLETLLDALDSGEFDLVGGVQVEEDGGRFAWEGLFRRDGDTLVLAPGDQGEVDGVKRVDFCLNFFAARTDAVREVRWDDHFKMGEHTDFFLRCQGRIRVGFCPGVRIRHEPERPSDYLPFRERAEQTYRRDFLEKHGLRELVNELHPGRDQPDTSRSRSRSALEALRAFFRRS